MIGTHVAFRGIRRLRRHRESRNLFVIPLARFHGDAMNRIVRAPVVGLVVVALTLLLGGCATTRPPPSPEPAAEATLPPRAYIEKLSADGLFGFGSASLGDAAGSEALAGLDALAAKLSDGRSLRAVHVIGHSDRIGSDQANLALSTRRAEAVRDYLIERGVTAGQITAVGRGSVEPVVVCATERGDALVECLAPNRRVEVRVSYGD